jgi:BASS family bile acid:Na+ symporter
MPTVVCGHEAAGRSVALPISSGMTEDLLIPLIVVLLMTTAGTGVRADQFRTALRSPMVLLGGTIAQVLLLPAVAVLLIIAAAPAPELAAGLILVAASPGGALSNFYCYLGRLNVSLSVMLTTLSTLISFATFPALLILVLPLIGAGAGTAIPFAEMMLRLVLFLLIPVGVGMLLRHLAPEGIERFATRLRAAGQLLLVGLIVLILFEQWQTVMATYREAVLFGVLFTLAAAVTGGLVGSLFRVAPDDRYVFAIEFAIRNLGAAALVASATLGRPEFLAFGALFVVIQLPLVFLLLKLRHHNGAATNTDDAKQATRLPAEPSSREPGER